MRFSSAVVAAVVAAGLSAAAPLVVERMDEQAVITDGTPDPSPPPGAPELTPAPPDIQTALTLEHLEDNFYRTGLQNFSEAAFAEAGFDATFFQNVKEIAKDEQTHVEFLTKALTGEESPSPLRGYMVRSVGGLISFSCPVDGGFTPVKECEYSFPVTDVKSFVLVSSILEGVGVTAYLGAAAQIMSGDILTAAGSILTVEARHSAFLRSALQESPFPQPFDVPLSLDEVFTLAAGFIVSCPADNPKLPVKAFPTLVLDPATPSPVVGGQYVTLLTPGYQLKPANGGTPIFGAWITVTGPIFVEAEPVNGGFSVEVPSEVNGQSYVVLTGCNETVTDDTVAAGPAIVEITQPLEE
ncbi:hypothetical protein FGG08_005168 [Glutinoglossum americanum]|uniref:Uncharacterized protein n=1 Tax=Glutinoglossum americanum TaxID=1670608 RepID=A0A9P8L347_9PEZI|nr:hypothetical protein FGG08_005168 [Glutinoglossum americanum]